MEGTSTGTVSFDNLRSYAVRDHDGRTRKWETVGHDLIGLRVRRKGVRVEAESASTPWVSGGVIEGWMPAAHDDSDVELFRVKHDDGDVEDLDVIEATDAVGDDHVDDEATEKDSAELCDYSLLGCKFTWHIRGGCAYEATVVSVRPGSCKVDTVNLESRRTEGRPRTLPMSVVRRAVDDGCLGESVKRMANHVDNDEPKRTKRERPPISIGHHLARLDDLLGKVLHEASQLRDEALKECDKLSDISFDPEADAQAIYSLCDRLLAAIPEDGDLCVCSLEQLLLDWKIVSTSVSSFMAGQKLVTQKVTQISLIVIQVFLY